MFNALANHAALGIGIGGGGGGGVEPPPPPPPFFFLVEPPFVFVSLYQKVLCARN